MMLSILISALFAAYLGFLAGRRYEKGNAEVDTHLREEIAVERSGRPGTIRLTSMKVRR